MNARLELLRRRLGQTGPARAGIPPRPDPDTAPLSAPQHRMWLHQQLYPASAAYNVCIRIDLAGDLDEDRLRAALAEIVNRHEVLRTTYPAGADGRPHQRIHRHLPPPVRIVESADPAQVARDAAAQPFDIATSGSIRFHLVRVGARQWSLVLTVHHIVWDGGCFGVFSHDLGLAYRGDGATPLAIQYADIAAHEAQHEAAASTDLDGQLDHWRRTLTPPPPALPLPSLRPFGPEVGERAERLDRTLPASGAKSLRAAAAALRTTPFVVFCAAYGLLLRRWTGETDITVGTMVANRHQPGTRELIGNFGNTALLRLDTSGDPTVRQLVARAAHTITGTLGNADIAFERVVADLAPAREPGHGFFTDTLCLFLDREIGGPDLPGVDVRWDNVPNGAAPFALTFQGFMNGDLLRVEATYRSELFAPATVNLMLEHLEAILLAATADPDQPCSTASQLPAGQRDHLARLSAGVATDRPAASVLGHWRRRAAATPDRTALVHGGRRFSYGEIDQGANRLAARLIERGMRAQDIVAVALARGPSTLTALLAIWKCGAVYLPLDPHHPKPRLIDLLSQADARLVIGDAALDLGGVPCLVAHQAGPVAIDPGHQPHALEAAHIGFTSGSTGGPKGVVTTHGSLAARTSWVAAHWPGGTGGARLAKSAPTAIDAVAELCEAITTGEVLVLATDEEARDAAALARLLETHSIGHVMAVPGLIQAVAIAAPGVISGRDRVLSTGEPLFPGTAGAIHDTAPGVPLYNSYGCTETTGDVAAGPVSAGDAQNGIVPIGTPLPGSFCHVLGPDLVPVPPGVLGEIYVGGPQLARGYLAQPALTAARFVASPFEAGGRLYRTGDLARWRDDGRLELAGRSDDQVNVRGHRVEPAEAVEALHALPNVREAAVLPRAVGTTTELVAYVAGDGLGPDDGPQLRQQLARTLPGPLVPAEVVVLPHLPRLNGGKIDRQALLRRPATPRAPATDTPPPPKPPQNDREAALAGILCAVLGRPSVGMDDDFFALGGDSLLAVSFAARAHAAGMSFPAAAVFQYPTIAQLVRQLPPPREEKAVALTLPPQTHRFRLSGLPVQDFVSWEALRGPVDTDRLRRALTETIARHAPLRQAISTRGRLWRATQAPATNGDAMVIEIGNADAGRALEIAAQAIDIAAGRVIVALVTADAALLAAHPTVIDGLSLARIAGEIDGQTQDPPPPQPAGQAAATPPAHWDAVLGAGPESPWWVGPDDPPPASPHARARAVTDTTDASILAGTLLRAVRTLSGREAAVADVEVDPELVGPLVAVPVISQTGREMIIGDAAAYTAYLSNRRPVAGGPGILIRRTVAPEPWQAGGIARGADRLYHIVASWQRLGGRTVLEVAAHEPGVAEALAATWAEALSGRERAHG